MINCHTTFGKLKSIIVGRELNIQERYIDQTFKYFFRENLNKSIYQQIDPDFPTYKYKLNNDILQTRIKQLDNFAELLESFNIKVYRPHVLNKLIQIKTPTFTTTLSSASNVRDQTFIYKNSIIETPPQIQNRYFENILLYDIFNTVKDDNTLWIKSPHTHLLPSTIDTVSWKEKRDWTNIPKNIEMAIDGAQFIPIGKDVIVNVSTYSHYLGYKWIKNFFRDTTFHMITIADNHIDGELICLKPGVFLINPKYSYIPKLMPDKFKNWKYLCPEFMSPEIDITHLTDKNIQLATSYGMDVNILSLDENTVMVNKYAYGVRDILEKNHFTVIPVELDNSEVFGGGLHCSTLDLYREDEFISYI